MTPEDLSIEATRELRAYMNRAIPCITTLSEEFHARATSKTWEQFSEFLEGLEWVASFIEYMKSKRVKTLNDDVQLLSISENLHKATETLMEAMNQKDEVLLADILLFEVKPLYIEIRDRYQEVH